MSTKVRIKGQDYGKFEKILSRTYKNIKNMSDVNHDVGLMLRGSTKKRFAKTRDPFGKKWRKSLRAKKTGKSTLTDTGSLASSIKFNSDKKTVRVGTSIKYAGVHQFGFKGKVRIAAHVRRLNKKSKKTTAKIKAHYRRIKTPVRAFLGLSTVDKKEILRIIREHTIDAD